MRLPTRLLHRRADTHKGDFGHIFILAGSARFSGAALLCAEAAMRSGAGLVTIGIPKSINNAVVKLKLKEVMTLPLPETAGGALSLGAYKKIREFSKKADILIIGPGLGVEPSTKSLIKKAISGLAMPAVIDADGLNALSGSLDKIKGKDVVITPHPLEFSRLLGVRIDLVQKKRKETAQETARKYKLTVVLKGHRTVVADSNGSLYINNTGNPGMATAGSGDVLTGIIAAFLGQGLDKFAAAKYAVYLHGLAGDLAAKDKTQIGMVASDIIEKLPAAIKRCF